MEVLSYILSQLAVRTPGREQGQMCFDLLPQENWGIERLSKMPGVPSLMRLKEGFKMICGLTLSMQLSSW